ncbi:MAG: glycosyltransferase family 2 protein [Anaerolineales bacterium]|nr:glycosyltransferase family 2 protein [Chloroflexota bacterium]MBL6980697.1 glycosyltransferase family 2 protein [Anaerolineales bacterium]
MDRPPISILLPTYNCESIVRDTLESVKWADEILVVDSYSTDETLDICREYGARIIQHEYIQSAKQKNWAVPQCKYEWVLQMDTDEILEEGAREEIIRAIQNAPEEVEAFRMARKNHVLGKWVRYAGIYPDWETRLFRRDKGRWFDREVHSNICVPGKVGVLDTHILHYGMPNITKQLRNLDRYTRYEADELRKQKRCFHWYDLLLRPLLIFFYRYLCLQGFRAGWRGFIVCVYLAVYQFFSYAKLWEMEILGLEVSPK